MNDGMRIIAQHDGTAPSYFLHGLDLIAQSDGTNTEYFAYDGLGSVRQVVDETAGVLLAQTYDPYGGVYASAGPGETHFGWTGEQVDASGLVYLRARYYSPGMGRFLSADPSRAEMNLYGYGAGNPVYYVDPSGYIRQFEFPRADEIIRDVYNRYNITIDQDYGFRLTVRGNEAVIPPGDIESYVGSENYRWVLRGDINCSWESGAWELNNLTNIQRALDAIGRAISRASEAVYGTELNDAEAVMRNIWGGLWITTTQRDPSNAIGPGTVVRLGAGPRGASAADLQFNVVHELGHIWDERSGGTLGFALSSGLAEVVGRREGRCQSYDATHLAECFSTGELPPGWNEARSGRQNYGARGTFLFSAAVEDFAESFANYVFQDYGDEFEQGWMPLAPESLRYEYIERQLVHIAAGYGPGTIASYRDMLPQPPTN
jgi:RHS repeat-associated protein